MHTQLTRRGLAGLLTVSVVLVLTASDARAARASKRQPATKTTVVIAPYLSPTTRASGCDSQINLTSSCRESVTAAPSGQSTGDIDAVVGDNVYLADGYHAYTAATFTVPITTTVPRTSMTVDALIRVHDAASVMDRPQYFWESGTPEVETEAWSFMNASAVARTIFTSIQSDSPADTHLESRVADRDYHVTFEWAPTGGIPAGTSTVTIELRQRVEAATNGRFRSVLEATLASVTFTER